VVLYLRGHEGRGVGLLSKLQAYELQDAGADTVDANTELGLPVDAREYSAGAQMLADLGVRSVRLLTNNPAKLSGLADCGVDITARVPLASAVTPFNLRYLITKRDKPWASNSRSRRVRTGRGTRPGAAQRAPGHIAPHRHRGTQAESA